MAVDGNLISIIIFYALAALFFFINRKNIEVQYKILFLYRTKGVIKWIRSLAKKYRKFWKWFGYAGIPAGFISMAFILGFLAWKAVEILIVPAAAPSVGIVLPGVKIPGAPFFVPFWYGILALFIVLIVHEGCHGLVAEAWGIKLKSAGVGLAAFLPLAFVEPDEKQLNRKPLIQQLSIFAAGPFANFCTAGLAIFLFLFLLVPAVNLTLENRGIYVEDVASGLPADIAGLQKGDIIISANGQLMNTTNDFVNLMGEIKPGQTILLQTSSRLVQVTTIQNPQNASKPYIGFQFSQNIGLKPEIESKYGKLPWGLFYLLKLFYWIFVLNIGIGLMNLLPLGPIDGGRMLKASLDKKLKNKTKAQQIWVWFTLISLFLILFNLVGPYLAKAFI